MERTRLCICQNDEQQCPIKNLMQPPGGEPNTNRFSTLDNLKQHIYPIEPEETNDPAFGICKPGYKMWKWDSCDCYLYYVFVFGLLDEAETRTESKERVREHEIVTPPHKPYHQIPKELEMAVIPLVKKDTGHGFVEIFKASGIGDHGMVVDLLSAVVLEKRFAIYFGFLTPSHTNFDQSIRIAVKREDIHNTPGWLQDGDPFGYPVGDLQLRDAVLEALNKPVTQITQEIELALQAGDGQYNMKYLACTNINNNSKEVWIALELCRMEIFKDLIMAEEDTRMYLDKRRKKICFSQILRGLMHLHENGILHGEITAENILVSLGGAELKIGDYDHIREIIRNRGCGYEPTTVKDDIIMTARVFLKCLKRDASFDSKILNDIDPKETEEWISSLDLSDSQQMKNSLSDIVEVAFYGARRKSIQRYMRDRSGPVPTSWTTIFMKLAGEPKLSEDPYLYSYLITYMAMESPTAREVRTHPFFWDEYKMECFVRRMILCFEDLQNPQRGRGTRAFGSEIMCNLRLALESIRPLEDNNGMADYHNFRMWPELVVNNCRLLSFAVCLLHRTVWPQRHSAHLPDNIKQMLRELSNLDPLNLRRNYLPQEGMAGTQRPALSQSTIASSSQDTDPGESQSLF